MNVNWLRKILHRLPGDMEIFINIDGEMIPLCGKIDLTLLTYHTLEEPDVEKGEQALTFKPCECHSDESEDEIHKCNLN